MESYKENLYHLKMTKSNKNSLQQQSIYGYKYQHHEVDRALIIGKAGWTSFLLCE